MALNILKKRKFGVDGEGEKDGCIFKEDIPSCLKPILIRYENGLDRRRRSDIGLMKFENARE